KDQAKRDVKAGLAAQAAGKYDDAIALYKKAYDAVPHPELLFDLGQAYRLKGDFESALVYYRRYLAVAPNGRGAKDAIKWVAQLDKKVKEEAERKAEEARKAEQARTARETPKPEEIRSGEARTGDTPNIDVGTTEASDASIQRAEPRSRSTRTTI